MGNEKDRNFNNLEEFLNYADNVKYDFKYQYVNHNKNKFRDLFNIDDNIKRFFAYKKNYKNNSLFDADGSGIGNKKYLCMLSRHIYRQLWDWEDINDTKSNNLKRYGILSINATIGLPEILEFSPDTMNSFVKRYREITESDEYSGFESVNEAYDKLSSFAVLTHTIGNFCLVPKGFNTHRNAMQNDFWDLSLLELKTKGFKKFKPEHFKQYIDTFFLWDYVDTNYEPLSLFLSNDDFKGKNGKGKDDRSKYNNFLENVEYAITNRGKFMVYMLNHEDKLKKFKGKLNSDYDFFAMYNKFLESGELTFDLRMQ